ncbi:GntR family transcriptional regulator [Noviherbaspirillum saxi]|uniref:GntR family transcriptional regulator n=1 Tax=Noviherbaspirillum saxi TaxID=2320863 RepID=A0A3A3FP17_9BURK|nr:GntR family transcriptional regulator [Noviherbaspirillum saxi]RJF95429.1 GntR family transcriptional regulator [Noviherbaspirillum saxi]
MQTDKSEKRSSSLTSTSARIADAVSRRIVRRHYQVGQRLVEAELVREFGVSRSTVREALKMLASSGVVELSHNRGALVQSLSAQDAQDLLQVLEMLSGLAARLAAGNIGRGNNRTRFEAVARPLTDVGEADELDRVLGQRANYYQVMFDIANNKELDRAMPLPRVHLFRTQFYSLLTKSDVRAMIAEYRAINEAILSGDEAKAETQMRRHIRNTADRTLPHFQSR